MVNKSECSKKFKNICDRTVPITKKEIHIAKNYSKLWSDYSTIKGFINENAKRLNSVNIALQKKTKIVEALKLLNKDRDEELEHIKGKINALQKEIETIQKNGSEGCEKSKSLQLRLLHMTVLQTCTKTHINDNKIPHLIQAFTANEELLKTIPLEIDPGRLTKSEIQNVLWENCYRSSGYSNEWEHLFNADSDGNS